MIICNLLLCGCYDNPQQEILGSRSGQPNSLTYEITNNIDNVFVDLNNTFSEKAYTEGEQSQAWILGHTLKSKSISELTEFVGNSVDYTDTDIWGDFLDIYAQFSTMEEAMDFGEYLTKYILTDNSGKESIFAFIMSEKNDTYKNLFMYASYIIDSGVNPFMEGFTDEVMSRSFYMSHRCAFLLARNIGVMILMDTAMDIMSGGTSTLVTIPDTAMAVAGEILEYNKCKVTEA